MGMERETPHSVGSALYDYVPRGCGLGHDGAENGKIHGPTTDRVCYSP